MTFKRFLALILIISIVTMSFSSIVQISAQIEEASNQAVKVAASEDGNVQTASRPDEITEKFVIDNKKNFSVFMTTSVLWGNNYKVTLARDIDMKGKEFSPIKEFGGVFDGCGHVISNLKIQDKSNKSKNSNLSFINTLNESAEIKNVKFDNYTVEGKFDIKKSAGLILTNHGTISDVDIINGSINNIGKKANAAGFVLDNEEKGLIENSHIENMGTKDTIIKSGFAWTNYGKIANCSTTLSVNSKDIAGGFCGINSGEVNDCKAEGSVKAKTSKGITICGGFIAQNSGMIKNCSSTGEVEGQEFTGGFVGINDDKGEISSSKATCNVKSHTYVATINCGGFVGVDAGKIEDCS
ncbi:MAG: hypothetical protein K2G97_04280, partial [Oscillospiraceae bacterium]|nr:hypothetical protein [Oscillospiraceae bacterium]